MRRMSTTPPSTPEQPGGGYGQSPHPAQPGGSPAKLDTAGAFERIFDVYGKQFLTLVGLALVVYLPIAILQGIIAASGSIGLIFVTTLLAIVGWGIYTGAVVEAVADMRDGKRDFSIGQLLQRALPFAFPLIGAAIIYGLAVLVGFVLIIIPGLIFMTWFSLFAPSIVVERQGVFASMTRSHDLVRGDGWRVFGVLVVTVIIAGIVGSIIQRIAIGIADNAGGAIVGNLISNLITAPIGAIAVATLFFMLREAKQGAPAPQPRY
jgi:hypothetical protein